MSTHISKLLYVLAVAGLLVASRATAQQYLLGGSADVASGIEGGGGETTAMRRARSRIRLGLDLRIDEFPNDIVGIGILADVEPHSAFGVDARYIRRVGSRYELGIGGIAYIAPQSLFGPSADFKVRFSLSSAFAVTVGPEMNVFVFGSDLPNSSIVWQGLLQVGIHVDL